MKNWIKPSFTELDIAVTSSDWLYQWGKFYLNDSQLDPSAKNYVSYYRQSVDTVS